MLHFVSKCVGGQHSWQDVTKGVIHLTTTTDGVIEALKCSGGPVGGIGDDVNPPEVSGLSLPAPKLIRAPSYQLIEVRRTAQEFSGLKPLTAVADDAERIVGRHRAM
jgi:hypothetical protein